MNISTHHWGKDLVRPELVLFNEVKTSFSKGFVFTRAKLSKERTKTAILLPRLPQGNISSHWLNCTECKRMNTSELLPWLCITE